MLKVSVAWAWPDDQREIPLELPPPASVRVAIDAACVLVPELAVIVERATAFGVWGKVRAGDYLLRDGDRVELYRALQADPKDARRAKAKRAVEKTGKM